MSLEAMQALAAYQIAGILKSSKSTRKVFKTVCARDVATRPPKKIATFPQAFIHNTGFVGHGIHWVLIYYTKAYTLFFDSFGRSPKELFLESSAKSTPNPIVYNVKTLQRAGSPVCGHYCIYFLTRLANGDSLASINSTFGKNLRKNDQLVFNFVKKLAARCRVPL